MDFGNRRQIRALRQRDPEACRRLIAGHSAKVFAYLRWLGADPELAEDLTQETYAKAWRGIDDLRSAESLRAWLLRIARNEYFQARRRPRLELLGIDAAQQIPDAAAPALVQVEESDRDARLRQAVRSLEPPLAETVVLHYFQALKLRDVATLLGIPVGTVKSRLNRALMDLRARLREEERDVEERAGKTAARTS